MRDGPRTIDFPFFDAVLMFFVGIWNIIKDIAEFFAVDVLGFMISNTADWVIDGFETVFEYVWLILDAIWRWAWWLCDGWVDDLWNWIWPTFADIMGNLILWVDGFLPEDFELNTTAVTSFVNVAKVMGFFVDFPYIFALLAGTFSMIKGLTVARFILKLIPGVG